MSNRIEKLRSMRKRRVGVTARSRQNVGGQETGTLQFVTEMAAPLEMRTPAGTSGEGCRNECGWKHGNKARRKSTSRRTIQEESQGKREEKAERRRRA